MKFSFMNSSFGQSAIFLIGGRDKSIEPSAIQLNSGDIVVMSEEARLCYHAVPKILETKATPWNSDLTSLIGNETGDVKLKCNESSHSKVLSDVDSCTDIEWKKISDYIAMSRINMNVRQVLPDHQTSLKVVR